MQKEIFKSRYEYHNPLHRTAAHSWSASYMPTSSAAAPPLPTQLLCTHIQTHSRAEIGWNKGDQVLLTATITPLEKKPLIMFLWCAGEWTGKSVILWLRPQHGENISRGSWAFPLSVQSNNRFEHILVGYISLSPSSLENHWRKKYQPIKAPANNGFVVSTIDSRV